MKKYIKPSVKEIECITEKPQTKHTNCSGSN